MFITSMFTGNKVEVVNQIKKFFHTLLNFFFLTKKKIWLRNYGRNNRYEACRKSRIIYNIE